MFHKSLLTHAILFALIILFHRHSFAADDTVPAFADRESLRSDSLIQIYQEIRAFRQDKIASLVKRDTLSEQVIGIYRMQMSAYADKFMALGLDKPSDAVAFECFVAAFGIADDIQDPKLAKKTMDHLLQHHGASWRMGGFCEMLANNAVANPVPHLNRIAYESPNAAIKGQAFLAIASTNKSLADFSLLPDAARKSAQDAADQLFSHVATKYTTEVDFRGFLLSDRATTLQNLAVGRHVPALTTRDLRGKPASLTEYKGKVVVLDFWATWCEPYQKELKLRRQMMERLASKGLAVIGVSGDERPETVVNFVKEQNIPWVNWFGGTKNDSVLRKWNVRWLPTVYIIDRKGMIRYKQIAASELESAVTTLLAEP